MTSMRYNNITKAQNSSDNTAAAITSDVYHRKKILSFLQKKETSLRECVKIIKLVHRKKYWEEDKQKDAYVQVEIRRKEKQKR